MDALWHEYPAALQAFSVSRTRIPFLWLLILTATVWIFHLREAWVGKLYSVLQLYRGWQVFCPSVSDWLLSILRTLTAVQRICAIMSRCLEHKLIGHMSSKCYEINVWKIFAVSPTKRWVLIMLPLGIKEFLHSCIVHLFCPTGEEAKPRNEPIIWLKSGNDWVLRLVTS